MNGNTPPPKPQDEFTRLYNLSLAVGSTFTLPDSLWALYLEGSQFVDMTSVGIGIYDIPTDTLHFQLVFDRGNRLEPFTTPCNPRGLASHVMLTQDPVLIHDLTKVNSPILETTLPLPNAPIRSWLGVAIPNPAQPTRHAQGVLALWSYQTNIFSNRDLYLLTAIAAQCAVPLRYVRMLEALQQRAMEIAVINELAQTMSTSLHLPEVLAHIMEEVENMLNAEAGMLLLYDSASHELVCQSTWGAQIPIKELARIPKGFGLMGEIMQTGKSLIMAEVTPEKRPMPDVQQLLGISVRNLLCIPLVVREHIVGVLGVFNKRNENFNHHDSDLMRSIISYATIAIENARLHEKVLAGRDRVIEASEEARKELARNLHDGPIQGVSSIKMRLSFCQEALQRAPEMVPAEILYLQQKADEAIHQMRTMMFELRPLVLESDGLAAAIEIFLQRRQEEIKGTKLIFRPKAYPPNEQISRQESRVETAIFAIVQEAVNNAIKHAQAKNIFVQLTEKPEAIYTVIADDGVGFIPQQILGNYTTRQTSLGMVNIRERAELIGSEVTIKSAPGMGAHIFVYTPKEQSERLKKRVVTGMLQFPLKK